VNQVIKTRQTSETAINDSRSQNASDFRIRNALLAGSCLLGDFVAPDHREAKRFVRRLEVRDRR